MNRIVVSPNTTLEQLQKEYGIGFIKFENGKMIGYKDGKPVEIVVKEEVTIGGYTSITREKVEFKAPKSGYVVIDRNPLASGDEKVIKFEEGKPVEPTKEEKAKILQKYEQEAIKEVDKVQEQIKETVKHYDAIKIAEQKLQEKIQEAEKEVGWKSYIPFYGSYVDLKTKGEKLMEGKRELIEEIAKTENKERKEVLKLAEKYYSQMASEYLKQYEKEWEKGVVFETATTAAGIAIGGIASSVVKGASRASRIITEGIVQTGSDIMIGSALGHPEWGLMNAPFNFVPLEFSRSKFIEVDLTIPEAKFVAKKESRKIILEGIGEAIKQEGKKQVKEKAKIKIDIYQINEKERVIDVKIEGKDITANKRIIEKDIYKKDNERVIKEIDTETGEISIYDARISENLDVDIYRAGKERDVYLVTTRERYSDKTTETLIGKIDEDTYYVRTRDPTGTLPSSETKMKEKFDIDIFPTERWFKAKGRKRIKESFPIKVKFKGDIDTNVQIKEPSKKDFLLIENIDFEEPIKEKEKLRPKIDENIDNIFKQEEKREFKEKQKEKTFLNFDQQTKEDFDKFDTSTDFIPRIDDFDKFVGKGEVKRKIAKTENKQAKKRRKKKDLTAKYFYEELSL